MKSLLTLSFALLLSLTASAKLTIREIRTASDNVIELFFTSDTLNVNEVDISNPSQWKVNGTPVIGVNREAAAADKCDHFVYLTVPVRQKHSYVYEPRWCYCRSEYNPATGDFTSNTILQIYPYTDVSGLHFTTYSYQPDIDKVERLDEWVINVYSGGLGQAVSYIDVKDINKSTGKP